MVSSLVNPKTVISPEKWAVTLTCDFKGKHARLILEGMEDCDFNSYFFRIAELYGPSVCSPLSDRCEFACGFSKVGFVKITEKKRKKSFEKRYWKKSETWLRSRDKIELVIAKIESEIKGGVPFNICGSKSIFSKDAEIYEIYDRILGYIAKYDRDLFLSLYDSSKNGGECTGMDQNSFDESIDKVLKTINKHFKVNDLSYFDLIEMVKISSHKIDQYQQNCFTWSREKLKYGDIELIDIDFEKIISITTYMTKYGPDDDVDSCDSCAKLLKKSHIEKNDKVIFERFVTYKTNRDIRTMEWRVLDNKDTRNKIIHTSFTVAGCSMFYLGVTALFISATITIPLVAGAGIFLCAGRGVQVLVENNQKNLVDTTIKESIKTLNHPGNKVSSVRKFNKK